MNGNNDGVQERKTQQSSMKSFSQEKMAKFIFGGYQKQRYEKEKNEKSARIKKEEEETAAVYSDFVKTFEDTSSSTSSGAPVFVRGGTINEIGLAESLSVSKPEIYILGENQGSSIMSTSAEKKSKVVLPLNGSQEYKQNDSKIAFTKFVPVMASAIKSLPNNKAKVTDLQSVFGTVDDDTTDESKNDSANRAVNRKTKIHYAIHKAGEKSQLDIVHDKLIKKQAISKGRGINEKQSNADDHIGSSYEDPSNCSVFIGNLPKSITDTDLYKLFAFYGIVKSVSIRSPHVAEAQTASSNIGFVCMSSHQEAQLVIENMQNHRLDQLTVRVGWGKGASKGSLSFLPAGANPVPVRRPVDSVQQRLIQAVAIAVHNRGRTFEALLLRRLQKSCPTELRFLDDASEWNVFYRWCVLVLGNNETLRRYSLMPFQFDSRGPWYLPPPQFDENTEKDRLAARLDSLNRSKADVVRRVAAAEKEENERVLKQRREQGSNIMLSEVRVRLSSDRFDMLCEMLRTITPSRAAILRLMAFCMDNSLSAEHIVCILRDSICDNVPYLKQFQDEVPGLAPVKLITVECSPTVRLARLYVVNDLLYNADNGCMTSYRGLLQNELPIIFESICRMKNNCLSQMMRKEIKLRVEKMLNGWIQNSLLSQSFLKGLQSIFLMSNEELDNELDDSTCEEHEDNLRLQCKFNGLCNYGSRGRLLMRLSKLNLWSFIVLITHSISAPAVEKEDSSDSNVEIDTELDGEPLDDDDFGGCSGRWEQFSMVESG